MFQKLDVHLSLIHFMVWCGRKGHSDMDVVTTVKMFISLKIQISGLQLYPHNKMFHKWNVDLGTEYSSSFSTFQTQKRQEGPSFYVDDAIISLFDH